MQNVLQATASTAVPITCAIFVKDPYIQFCMMILIALTCMVVLVNTLVSCWRSNRKILQKRKQEAMRHGRVPNQ